jgi:hypothetical protein
MCTGFEYPIVTAIWSSILDLLVHSEHNLAASSIDHISDSVLNKALYMQSGKQ